MAIKKFKSTSPGRRHMVINRPDVSNEGPEKSLLGGKVRKTGGRNVYGRLTVRHRGGGVKRRYRVIDFHRRKDGVPARVARIEYDPNRSANIALLHYVDGEKTYIIAPQGIAPGDMVESGPEADIKPGNALPLRNIPSGTVVHNIELKPGRGGQLARAAGASARLSAKEGKNGYLRMPSGEFRLVPLDCRATVGQVGNVEHENQVSGKAGRQRHLGRRPTVRGSVMNPVDHPLGGGEGKAPAGRHPVTPWGKKAHGKKTRKGKKYSDKNIVRRRRRRR